MHMGVVHRANRAIPFCCIPMLRRDGFPFRIFQSKSFSTLPSSSLYSSWRSRLIEAETLDVISGHNKELPLARDPKLGMTAKELAFKHDSTHIGHIRQHLSDKIVRLQTC
jgi:hypothetical protein